MKARVNETRVIVDVTHSHNITLGGIVMKKIYKDQLGCEYSDNELEFLQEVEYIPDYWTRLEHRAAIAAMQGLCANYTEFTKDNDGTLSNTEMIVENARLLAHDLVEKMKKEK